MSTDENVEVTERAYRSMSEGPTSDTEAFVSDGVAVSELDSPTLDRTEKRGGQATGAWPTLTLSERAAPPPAPSKTREGPDPRSLLMAVGALVVIAVVAAAAGAVIALMGPSPEEDAVEVPAEAPDAGQRIPVRDGLR